jgi:hypothetical protein
LFNRNIEQFDRSFLHGSNIVLGRLPIGKVNLVIPEWCMDRKQGIVNIEKLKQYLNSQDNVFIEYEID